MNALEAVLPKSCLHFLWEAVLTGDTPTNLTAQDCLPHALDSEFCMFCVSPRYFEQVLSPVIAHAQHTIHTLAAWQLEPDFIPLAAA